MPVPPAPAPKIFCAKKGAAVPVEMHGGKWYCTGCHQPVRIRFVQ